MPHSFFAPSNCYIDLVQTLSSIFISISTKIFFCLFHFRIALIWKKKRFLRDIQLWKCKISLKTCLWLQICTVSLSSNNWVLNIWFSFLSYQEDLMSSKVTEDPRSWGQPFTGSLRYKQLSRIYFCTLYICIPQPLLLSHIIFWNHTPNQTFPNSPCAPAQPLKQSKIERLGEEEIKPKANLLRHKFWL